jgi:hypothetical protein
VSYSPQPPLGQAPMTGSTPVVIATNQSAIPITDNNGSLTVDGTIAFSNTGLTVNNASGASAVNVQDGGNSLTVDGTVAFSNTGITVNNAAGAAAVNVQDGGNSLTVDGTIAFSNTGLTVNNAAGASAVNIQDGGNSITVDGSVSVSNFPAVQAISGNQSALSATTWNSGTTINSAATVTTTNLNTVTVAIVATSTITGGVISFEVSPDNTNWFPISMARIDSYTVESTYTLVASVNKAWSTSVDGFTNFRVRLSTIIAGSASVSVLITAQVFSVEPIVCVGQSNASNLNATVTQQTLTKGTQGATGVTTQDLKDAGRATLQFYAVAAAAGATGTETAITLTKASGTSATSTGTSFVITNGKTFRITSITVATRGNATATIQSTTFNLRINTAGAVVTTSTPIVMSVRSATPATASAWDRFQIPLPDGLEYAGNGTIQFGMTAAATYVTNAPTWDVYITGFEY